MSDSPTSPADAVPGNRPLQSVQLVGFSGRDRELLRLFLRRPPGAGVSLSVVDDDADVLIGNATTTETLELLRSWSATRPAIGIVERYERDAPFYQVAQDSQMLFSLAQAINRIRDGWVPPTVSASAEDGTGHAAEETPAAPQVAATEAAEVVAGEAATTNGEAAPPVEQPAPEASTGEVARQVARPPAVSNGAAAIVASAGLPWQRALNILVIDDSHFSRVAISDALIKVGFAVDTVESGEQGLQRAAEKVYDVALVDFEMPGMRGPEVMRKLRALGPQQAPSVLIMLTSRTGSVDRLRAKFAGCDAYLTKPTRMQEFLSTLREFAIAGKLSRP